MRPRLALRHVASHMCVLSVCAPIIFLCSLDKNQIARFGVVGCTLHGPFFLRGFAWLDSTFGPAATLRQVRCALLGAPHAAALPLGSAPRPETPGGVRRSLAVWTELLQ